MFLEVTCKSSGKVRRFAGGTESRFALYLINKKLDIGLPPALYIEAVKEGEEPVNFGPTSVLVDYGHGWKLQTVTEEAVPGKEKGVQPIYKQNPTYVVTQPRCIELPYVMSAILINHLDQMVSVLLEDPRAR
ncbi:hypothetical protein BVC80_1017g15 [Macleaya cordata]|uniref:Uncharacterized protein n=1 Tax=Macleaya cordata TaxID=56857 RepID=A0A200QM95_MACCD|nr:hypothetical protein BVC80_1017g15 [Macleaya cordata]